MKTNAYGGLFAICSVVTVGQNAGNRSYNSFRKAQNTFSCGIIFYSYDFVTKVSFSQAIY
jgi:hypothetical protein